MGKPGPRLPVARGAVAEAARRGAGLGRGRRKAPAVVIRADLPKVGGSPIPMPPTPKPTEPCGECACCRLVGTEVARLAGLVDSYEAELASVSDSETMEDLIERQIRKLFKVGLPLKLADSIETAVKYYAAKRRNDPSPEASPKWGSALGAGANGGKL